MSLAVLHSRAQAGIESPAVSVEVHLANGLPALSIVGLAEMAVRESKDRVRGALLNSRFEFPARRITINLAPADLPKEGGRFDLPIALGILAASGQIPAQSLERCEVVGELALSGALRPVRGLLPVALACREAGHCLILPRANLDEALLIEGLKLLPADHLLEVVQQLCSDKPNPVYGSPGQSAREKPDYPDLADVRGQQQAKRALLISAAGRHSLLMSGPPGSGKSMLANRLPGLLPRMSDQEALETAAIRSISEGGFSVEQWRKRPFRAPHHTASGVALVGGGSNPRPGEISLAHNGVLFLDELPEFDRKVLEVLREPLESNSITISRAARQACFPARFQLIAAMNPCPCGYRGDTGPHNCNCTLEQVQRYHARISGPLLDRIDMQIEVPRLGSQELLEQAQASRAETPALRRQVERCRTLQLERSGCPNSELTGEALQQVCQLDSAGRQLLQRAIDGLGLSARAYHRVLRLARTIADLEQSEPITTRHLGEAITYRRLDRNCR